MGLKNFWYGVNWLAMENYEVAWVGGLSFLNLQSYGRLRVPVFPLRYAQKSTISDRALLVIYTVSLMHFDGENRVSTVSKWLI